MATQYKKVNIYVYIRGEKKSLGARSEACSLTTTLGHRNNAFVAVPGTELRCFRYEC